MPDTVTGVATEQLAEMIANLSAHIEERAAEIAKPRIEAAFTAACAGIADAEREAIFEKQRLDDLTVELRRQVECQVLRAERAEAERDNCLDRLRKAEGAYSRLDAQWRDAEGARDRWKARAEQAEATIERVRALHKQLREDIAVCDHCDEDYPCTTARLTRPAGD